METIKETIKDTIKDVTGEIKALYGVIDRERIRQGLPVPYSRDIRVFIPTNRKYRFNLRDKTYYVISDIMNTDCEGTDYMRYATVIGNGRSVYGVYYRNNKIIKTMYAGELGLHHKCVVKNYW